MLLLYASSTEALPECGQSREWDGPSAQQPPAVRFCGGTVRFCGGTCVSVSVGLANDCCCRWVFLCLVQLI